MPNPLHLFSIGQRGVDIVHKPQDLDESELILAQNAEILPTSAEGAVDQRPGMSKINASALGGSVAAIHDVRADSLTDHTPTLYAALGVGATHKWRKSTDGVTWSNDDTPTAIIDKNSVLNYSKDLPKVVTIGRKMFWADQSKPVQIHSYDGTTDTLVAAIPPRLGVSLAAPSSPFGLNQLGSGSATTLYNYKLVARNGSSNSAASGATAVTWSTTLSCGGGYVGIVPNSPPVAGATSYDVYRTLGGATQGKIGSIPISGGAFTTGNGSGCAAGAIFTDGGLTGDASTPPSSAGGTAPGDAIAVLDMFTDGFKLYLAVLDSNVTEPSLPGRILVLDPTTGVWDQQSNYFSQDSAYGKGAVAGFCLNSGFIRFSTYTGATDDAFNVRDIDFQHNDKDAVDHCAKLTVASPSHETGTVLAGYLGQLYFGTHALTAIAAVIGELLPDAGATTSVSATHKLSGVATAAGNAFTSLYPYNGKLYAGWSSGDGGTAARISSFDGNTWTTEKDFGTSDVIGQMVAFTDGNLYVVLGRTAASWNTTSSIWQRTPSGTWTKVDDPTDDFRGGIAVVYA